MSSSAIMALIKQKEQELEKLQVVKKDIEVVESSIDCITGKFNRAGEFMKNAGTIDGKLFDSGKTISTGREFHRILNNTTELKGEVSGNMATLEAEIAELYAQYQRALALERELEKKKKMGGSV